MAEEEQRAPAAVVFDTLGIAYEQAFAASGPHLASLSWLVDHLMPGSRVLDVGSGTGRPTAEALARAGHRVLGVDVSPVMVELATRQVPDAEFKVADIRDLELEEGSFEAVCVYFSLLQMSRDEQRDVLTSLARALRPGGLAVLATVPVDVADAETEFMGQPVRVSSFSPEDFAQLATDAGFSVLSEAHATFMPAHADAGPEPHLFLYCRRTAH
ncbi:class I SAM-dependent methyltransferase [Streptomyces griseoluteus]|uniref:class I SAM-dependent methyltransferase n=1 Tax=Streptomyces griseoluteus TaxID=29306 RepID=UPI0036FDB365